MSLKTEFIAAFSATLNNIGALLFGMGRHKEAMKRLDEAVNLRIASLKPDPDKEKEEEIKLRYQKAQLEEEELVKMYEFSDKEDLVRSSSLDMFESSDMEEVNFCFSDALRIDNIEPCSSSTQGTDSAKTMFNIGLIHHRLGSHDKAMHLFRMALCAAPSAGNPALAVTVLNNIAQVQYRQGLYNDALHSFFEALSLEQEAIHALGGTTMNGENNPSLGEHYQKNVATTLSGIGRIYFRNKRYDKAIEMCRETLRLKRVMLGDDHLHVAVTNYNIGLIFWKKGDLREAIQHCRYFVHQASGFLGTRHQYIFVALQKIGVMQRQSGHHDHAKETLSSCLHARKIAMGNDHYVAETSFQLGIVSQANGELDEALTYYNEAVQINSVLFGDVHQEVFKILCNIAQIYRMKGELDQALNAYGEVLRVSRILFGELDEIVASLHGVIGGIYYQRGEQENALASYAQSSRISIALRQDTFDFRGLIGNDDENNFTSAPAA